MFVSWVSGWANKEKVVSRFSFRFYFPLISFIVKDFILFGPQNNSEYVVTGSDWGKVIFWNKQTAEMMKPLLTLETVGTVGTVGTDRTVSSMIICVYDPRSFFSTVIRAVARKGLETNSGLKGDSKL